MKKLIYTTLALVIASTTAMAQSMVQGRPGHKVANSPQLVSPVKNQHNKADIQSWYDPQDWLNAFTGGGSTLQTFVDFLLPDSLASYINEGDTAFRFYSVAVGQVIDPKDDVIDLTDDPNIKMNQYSAYTVDSFYLTYLYVRNVDSIIQPGATEKTKVVDTLLVSYLKIGSSAGNGLTKRGPIGTAPNQFVFAEPTWSIANFGLTNFIGQEKFALTDEDSTIVLNNDGFENSWRMKTMVKPLSVPVSIAKNADNMFGITFQFILGMPHDTNSVFVYQKDPSTFPAEKNRINYFGYRFANNTAPLESQWRSTKFYNHSLYSDKENAYYPSGNINNGWDGFIPGNAYFQSRYLFSGMHATGNVGVKENELVSIANLYPNPASNKTTLALNLKKSGNVNVTVVNLIGQEMSSVNAGNKMAGNNTVDVDLTNLNAGIYFITVNVDGNSTTKKITVSK